MQELLEAKQFIEALEERKSELKDGIRNKVEIISRLSAPKAILRFDNPISIKMRACFYLRTEGTDDAAKVLCQVVQIKNESVLLRHEAAYCLGQMKRTCVMDDLIKVLQDKMDDSIVRHECAEALGAIGELRCVDALKAIALDEAEPREVRETCDIALDRFKDIAKGSIISAGEEDGFNTVDPAIVTETNNKAAVEKLEENLNSLEVSLYERYRAMFALRNRAINARGEDERTAAVLAISRALLNSKQGALFRHEVAFVLGQLSHEASVPFLKQALDDLTLHDMVRHESAEALGGIGTDEALEILQRYLANQKEAQIVRESCEVALDAVEYWKQFEKSSSDRS
jgi:deoxyhypusine monooxygenase